MISLLAPLVIDIEADMTVAWSGLQFSQTLKQQIYLNDTQTPKVEPKPARCVARRFIGRSIDRLIRLFYYHHSRTQLQSIQFGDSTASRLDVIFRHLAQKMTTALTGGRIWLAACAVALQPHVAIGHLSHAVDGHGRAFQQRGHCQRHCGAKRLEIWLGAVSCWRARRWSSMCNVDDILSLFSLFLFFFLFFLSFSLSFIHSFFLSL